MRKLVLLSAIAFATTLFAQNPTLVDKLAQVRQPINIENGMLTGAGGQSLLEAVKDARYVMVGEDHGIAQIPEFCSALMNVLGPAGFKTAVVEVGPVEGSRLDAILDRKDPDAAIQEYARRYPFSLAFYTMQQEFAFLKSAKKSAGSGFHVYGVDQELMGAGKLVLESVAARHPKGPIADSVKEFLKQEASAYAEAAKTGNPNGLFMMAAKPEDFTSLKQQLLTQHDAEGAAMVEGVLESRAVYSLYFENKQFESNQRRALLMKRTFGADYRRTGGAPQKVFFKFGANHVMKGLNNLNSRELGSYVAETAEGDGAKSVHILIVAVSGNQLRFGGIGKAMIPAPIDMIGPGQSDFPFAKPIFEGAMKDKSQWSLFDFRSLRDYIDHQKNADPMLVRMIFGYDFAVIIPEGTPSTEIR